MLKAELSDLLSENFGFVVRTNAQYASIEEVKQEALLFIKEYETIATTGIHKTKYSLLYQDLPPYLQQFRDSRECSIHRMVTNIPNILLKRQND